MEEELESLNYKLSNLKQQWEERDKEKEESRKAKVKLQNSTGLLESKISHFLDEMEEMRRRNDDVEESYDNNMQQIDEMEARIDEAEARLEVNIL